MKLVLIPLTAAALSACAPMMSQPSSGMASGPRQCFRSSEIRSHTIGDDRTLYLNVAGRETWRATMRSSCLSGATRSDPIVTRQPPGSSMVCSAIDLDLSISRGGAMATPCMIESLTRLSPPEAAALPPKLRP